MVGHGTIFQTNVSCRWTRSSHRALHSNLCAINQPSKASTQSRNVCSRAAPRQAAAASVARVETIPEADDAVAPAREQSTSSAKQQPVTRARFSSADNRFDRVLQGAQVFVLLGFAVVCSFSAAGRRAHCQHIDASPAAGVHGNLL